MLRVHHKLFNVQKAKHTHLIGLNVKETFQRPPIAWIYHPSLFRVVLTGGPCGGKSTILSRLTNYLQDKGFAVLHVQESATTLKCSGMEWCPELTEDFQTAIVKIQLHRERIACEWAEKIAAQSPRGKTVVFYDRGLLDGLAFVDRECLNRCLRSVEPNVDLNLFRRYDACFHLVTAAEGAEEHFVNTSFRRETAEEAREQDMKLRKAWVDHPYHYLFQNDGGFDAKVDNVISVLSDLLHIDSHQTPLSFSLTNRFQIPTDVHFVMDIITKTHITKTNGEDPNISKFLLCIDRAQDTRFNRMEKTYNLKQVSVKNGSSMDVQEKKLKESEYLKLKESEDFSSKTHSSLSQIKYIVRTDEALYELIECIYPHPGTYICNVYVNITDFTYDHIPTWIHQLLNEDITSVSSNEQICIEHADNLCPINIKEINRDHKKNIIRDPAKEIIFT